MRSILQGAAVLAVHTVGLALLWGVWRNIFPRRGDTTMLILQIALGLLLYWFVVGMLAD